MLAAPATPDPSYDYADACTVAATVDRPAADWLRLMLDGAPPAVRLVLASGWTLLTVRRPGGPGTVLGWPLVEEGADRAVLRTTTWIGIRPDLVLTRDGGTVTFASHVGLETRASRVVWALVGGPHRVIVRWLLGRAARTS